MPASNILHATTDPDLLTRLREMLDSSARADIAVGYFFMSGFEAVADSLARLDKVRILVGRTDRPTLESVALGLQQSQALRAQLEADSIVQRRKRDSVAQDSVNHIANGVAVLPQTTDSERAVCSLRGYGGCGQGGGEELPTEPATRQGLPVLVWQPPPNRARRWSDRST